MPPIDDERRRLPWVFVSSLDTPVLRTEDFKHLTRALRVAPGAPILVSDGAGRFQRMILGGQGGPERLVLDGEIITEPVPEPKLTVGFVPVKGGRAEWTVQKLVELGIDHIVVLESGRSVVRWDATRADKHLSRLRITAREAAMQSKRSWLASVTGPILISEYLQKNPSAVLADPSGTPLSASSQTVLIGPEGGWSPAELGGNPLVSAPGMVLRAETASLVVATCLVGFRSGHLKDPN